MTTTRERTVVDELLSDNAQLIGGEWLPAAGGEVIAVLNPATQEHLLNVPRSRPVDVDAAVEAATRALPAWRETSPALRAALLTRWAQLCTEHERELDQFESMEVGRPSWGPPPTARILNWVASLTDKITGLSLPTHSPDTLGLTLREPYGAVGSVIPWNAPAPMFVNDVGPAIAAGNTIVIKPAEDAPLTALLLARLAVEAGIPAGVVNVVTGYGDEAGAAIPAHSGIRRMSFTGSPATGRLVMAACAANLTPLHLELGGKSPQVVMSDADLARAVPAMIRSITMNSGQICAAGSRVVVERSIHAEVVERLAAGFADVRVGHWHEDIEMGPLINGKQQERVLGYIKLGQDEGATLVTGGGKPGGDRYERGFFVEPTLFDNVTPDMRIATEEIFGPVLSVIPVDGEAEAVEVANGTDYGLAAAVWTQDSGRAVRMAKRVQAGQVAVNSAGAFGVIGAPFGGYKNSGFGRTMGADSVLDYTQTKTVAIDASA